MNTIEHNGYHIVAFADLPAEQQVDIDEQFTAFTRSDEGVKAAMTWLEPGDILAKQWGAVALDPLDDNRPAAYAGAKVPVMDMNGKSWSEVGTSITMPEDREQGLGTKVAGLATRQVLEADVTAVAFTNTDSQRLYVDRLGYTEAGEGEVPTEFYEPCTGCPFRDWKIGEMCCDTIVKHEGEFDGSVLWPDSEPDQAIS